METKPLDFNDDFYIEYLTSNAFPSIHAKFLIIMKHQLFYNGAMASPILVQRRWEYLNWYTFHSTDPLASKFSWLRYFRPGLFQFFRKYQIQNSHQTNWWAYITGREFFWDQFFEISIWGLSDFSITFQSPMNVLEETTSNFSIARKMKWANRRKCYLVFCVPQMWIVTNCHALNQKVIIECLKSTSFSL